MKRINILFAILVIVSIINIEIKLHAQPKISKEKIPKSIPVDVRKQIERLYSSFPEERGYAAVSLSKMGSRATPAIPFLISILNDNTTLEWQRLGGFEKASPAKEAAKALGKIKDSRAVEVLIARLKDNDWMVRWSVAKALGYIRDKRAVKPLITALKDNDWNVRASAALALGEIRDTRAVGSLIAALKDSMNPYIRRDAANALGKINNIRAVEPLIEALKDRRGNVRASAAAALKRITGEEFAIDYDGWFKWWQENKDKCQQR